MVADVWQEEHPCARSEGGHELAPYLKVGNNHPIFLIFFSYCHEMREQVITLPSVFWVFVGTGIKGLIGFLPSKICCGGFSLQSHIEDGCYQTWVVMILLLFCLG